MRHYLETGEISEKYFMQVHMEIGLVIWQFQLKMIHVVVFSYN